MKMQSKKIDSDVCYQCWQNSAQFVGKLDWKQATPACQTPCLFRCHLNTIGIPFQFWMLWSIHDTRFAAAVHRIPSSIQGATEQQQVSRRKSLSLTLLQPSLLNRMKKAAIHTTSCFSFVNAPVVLIERANTEQSLLCSPHLRIPESSKGTHRKPAVPASGKWWCSEVYYDREEPRL